MRRYHILCYLEKRMPLIWKINKLPMTYNLGLLSFYNLIKVMLNALIKVIMSHLCF